MENTLDFCFEIESRLGSHLASALRACELKGRSSILGGCRCFIGRIRFRKIQSTSFVVVNFFKTIFVVVYIVMSWWCPWLIGRLAHLGQEALNVLNELDAPNFKPLVARASHSDTALIFSWCDANGLKRLQQILWFLVDAAFNLLISCPFAIVLVECVPMPDDVCW